MSPDRWRQLMGHWGASGDDAEFEKLVAAYSESHRHYHSTQHITSCLNQFDEVADQAQYPKEVEAALWYHDAIYKTRSSTNERDSAHWASRYLESIGASPDQCHRVHRHILATKHTGEPLTGDTAIVVDVDVSILGAEPATYSVYQEAIRKEYRWVPEFLYRRKRIEILQAFLGRATLYETESFRHRYEEQARENLRREIEELRSHGQ